MTLFDRFRKGKQPPRLLYTYPAEQVRWGQKALLVWIPDGDGILKERFGDDPSHTNTNMNSFLLLDDIPLIQWQSNECPTCNQLLAAGYGIDHVDPSVVRAIEECSNQGELTADSIETVAPLLQLLESGLYLLTFIPHAPTNGEGEFFWEFAHEPKFYDAFRPDADEISSYFLLSTQPKRKYDPARVDFYREQYRQAGQGHLGGIAYYLSGAFSALLDGHHRATAAALEGAMLNCLTIVPASIGSRGRDGVTVDFVYAAGHYLDASAVPEEVAKKLHTRSYKERQITAKQTNMYQRMTKSDRDDTHFPHHLQQAAKQYFTCRQRLAISEAGDITDEQIEKRFEQAWYEEASEMETLLTALFATQDPRAVPTAKRVLGFPVMAPLWYETVQMLATIRTPEVEQFFINWLIEDDKQRPEITKIIVDYFQES